MDPCHSVVRASPPSSALTVAHLIRNIEQLKNKDKIISQLEKDLGHQWGAAQFAALERRRSEGSPLPPGGIVFSHPLRALPDGSECPETLLWTPTSTQETEGVEDARSNILEGTSINKQDLLGKLKDSKDRTKELLEKCRSYLQQNKELTAQKRAFQESNERATQDFKSAQELLEHSKLQVLHLNRQLSLVKMEKSNLEQQALGLDRLREEIAEDKKMINALRKACSDKDRRIELIQHRKKRRRVLGTAEKQMFQSAGLRETYYGYEEDSKMAESNQSLSSSKASTISDEVIWDDEISLEDMERNYQRLVLEHLELQKSHALLQRQSNNMLDPQREHMDKTALQNDLFSAQCRIEHLEKLVTDIGEGEVKQLLMERAVINETNRHLEDKARNLERRYHQLQKELTKAEERNEELEFRLMELEQCEDRDQNIQCEVSSTSHAIDDGLRTIPIDQLQNNHLWKEVGQEMDQLRKELAILLKGKGKEAEAVLKKFDQIKETERKMNGSFEAMAKELQVKVISLQQENNSLEDKLLLMEKSQPGKGYNSSSLSAARERQENLELKEPVENQDDVDFKLSDERNHLIEELESWKAQCRALSHQLEAMSQSIEKEDYQHQGAELSQIIFDSSYQKDQRSILHTSPSEQHSSTLLPSLPLSNKSRRKSKSRGCDDPMTASKRRKGNKENSSSGDKKKRMKNHKNVEDDGPETEFVPTLKNFKFAKFSAAMAKFDEGEGMKKRILFLEEEVLSLTKENNELTRQVKARNQENNIKIENDQAMRDHIALLETELDLLHKENGTLSQQLQQRADEFQYQRDDLSPRISELEEYCEDLQEQLRGAEVLKRQLCEKLKLVEGSISDAENSELAIREQCNQLLASDQEAKKQLQALHKTGQDLKDIVVEKEFVEQALRDKVDFLQKAEAASVQRIEELEQVEKELREQLEQKSDGKSQNQKDAHKIQELKHQVTFLQKDNQALSARVTELEENEETLRENWRRVADEDFNRTQCLEEKVKMLESLNKELKSKLIDAQEYYVINTVPQLDTSLAAELAESQSRRPDFKEVRVEGEDAVDSAASDTEGERKTMKENLKKLERKLSEVTEKKNTKIESLQEQLVSLRETEIKLSETISEMEMTERELKAKLALYESSEVTVEKMLKYQSKIEELRTSQESLLDQLETMENQEMSLQEKMQEMERTLRGKIVTLEVEMKRFKQKELKNAGRIRDLEKQEGILTTKVAQQAEKENNLYMKINSLMEELKSTKADLEKAREQMEEKEEKVRQAKLLEVKLLEIEMDYGKKTNELNTKLRHQEEEFRQKDAASEQEIHTLRGEVAKKDALEKEQIKNWELSLAQRTTVSESAVSALNNDLNKINVERDELKNQVTNLSETILELRDSRTALEKEISTCSEEVKKLNSLVNEKEESISSLSKQIEDEMKRSQIAEDRISELEIQLVQEKKKVLDTEVILQSLKSEIESKTADMNTFVAEKENERLLQLKSLESEIELKKTHMEELTEELKQERELVEKLQSERDQLKLEVSQTKAVFTEEASKLKNFSEDILSTLNKESQHKFNVMNEKLKKLQENVSLLGEGMADNQNKNTKFEQEKAGIVKEWEEKLAFFREEQNSVMSELKSKVMILDNQLQQEVMEKEEQQTSFQKVSLEKETLLNSEIDTLQQEVETHKKELIGKLSELETKNKEHCELSLQLTELRHSYKTLQKEHDHSKDTENKLTSLLSEKDEKLKKTDKIVQALTEEVDQLKVVLTEKDNTLETMSADKDQIVKEKDEESKRTTEEKSQKIELETKLYEKSKELEEIKEHHKDLLIEMETLKNETEERQILLQQHIVQKEEDNIQLQKAHDECDAISQKLSDAIESLKQKDIAINEQKELLDSKSLEFEKIKSALEQKQDELKELSENCQVSESHHLSQLSQHQQNIEKYVENIKELQNTIEEKDQLIYDRDQSCKQIQTEMEGLNLQLKQREEKLQQAETQVADVTRKLKQVENRYRELESKRAQLELTLEERYAVAQDAEKILTKKEIQCKEMEEKLEEAEKKLEILQDEVSTVYDDSNSVVQRLEEKERELDHLNDEICQLKTDLDKSTQECSAFEAKFQETKEKCTFLENQYDQEKEKVVTTESCLLETEKECRTLQEKVSDCHKDMNLMEENCSKLKDQVASLRLVCEEKDAKIQILNRSLEEYEIACQEKNVRINSLELELSEGERLNSQDHEQIKNLRDQISKGYVDVEVLKSNLKEVETQMDYEKKEKEEIKSQLLKVTEEFEVSRQEIVNLNSNLALSQNVVEEKEKYLKESQTHLASLEQKNNDSRSDHENLKSQLETAQGLCDEKVHMLEQVEEMLRLTKTELDVHKEKLEQAILEGKNIEGKWQETQKLYTDSLLNIKQLEENVSERDAEIKVLHDQASEMDLILSQMTAERDALFHSKESLNLEVHNKENKLKSLISDVDALSVSVTSHQNANISLQSTVKELQEQLSLANTKCSEIHDSRQSLLQKITEVETENSEIKSKFQDLERKLVSCCAERDSSREECTSLRTERGVLENENQQLQKELEIASKEFDNLRLSCEESKTNIEQKVHYMSQEKEQLEKTNKTLQQDFDKQIITLCDMNQKMTIMENRVKEAEKVTVELENLRSQLQSYQKQCEQDDVVKSNISQVNTDTKNLQVDLAETKKKNLSLLSEIQLLKDQLSLTGKVSSRPLSGNQNEEEIVSESSIQVSFAPSLQSSLRAATADTKKLEDEIFDEKVEQLSSEIASFKLRDDSFEQQILNLEKALKAAKGREETLEKRVHELESIEKELREQIVDIDKTVIVPLETENQELKDEIGMVRQERDDAISKVSSWDDDESGVEAVESAHQRLEEALVQLDELEKKNEILLNDINKLESEKDNLVKVKTELEVDTSEKDEKLEELHEEVERLLQVEEKVLVLEESETRLMDRVLDLEEREQNLTQEMEKISSEKAAINDTEHKSKQGHLEKKLKYLEEKNQVLQDAEGHYMDKVMELEELVDKLKSDLSSYNLASLSSVHISTSEELSDANINSLSVSTQTSVPFQSNITFGANVNVVDNLENNMSQLSLPQEKSTDSSVDVASLQNQLVEIEKDNKNLLTESQEKDIKISYLQDKMELLRDSEAKLMEKLLEAEENISRVKSETSKTVSDLSAKIEHFQEENDFLAGNVENYQKLYKEEKVRSDDLQDRLMENSSSLAELTRTQQELANTEQMVEEIQSEYEEQLSERQNIEIKLREDLSKLNSRHQDLEIELAAKCQREIELGLRIDTMEKSEKELKARVEALMRGEEEESLLSDSGLSGDDPRSRLDAIQENQVFVETPVSRTSSASILLSTPRPHANPDQSRHHSISPILCKSHCSQSQSLEETPHRELVFLVEDLQQREEYLKKKVQDLTPLGSAHSSARLEELEARNLELERRLHDAEQEKTSILADAPIIPNRATTLDLASYQGKHQYSVAVGGGDSNKNDHRRWGRRGEEADKKQDQRLLSALSLSSSSLSSSAMLEKPEDVLIQRIRELEGLDKHNKNQLSELEKDREVLHEIARKDKTTIHDLNVKIRELQLSERSLKEQVANLEVSENSLFSKCEELEAIKAQLEDRVHELEIHERRLRELVRKLKLDEERWLSKSGGFETAVAELSANEQQLKRLLQDVEMEKGGLSERAEYFQARIRELESVETSLLSRVENYETNEVSLQNRLVLLENSETASRSKASELDILNKDLTQRMKKVSDENAMMSQHLSQLHGQIQELDRRLLASRDSELAFKQHVESLQKNESMLQKKVREYELREIDTQSQVRELEQLLEINKDKIAALQRSENRLKYRVQELEGLGAPIPGELTPSQRQKIPQKLEDCQKRIVVLQSQVENLQLQLRQALNSVTQIQPAEKSDDNNNVTIATEEYSQLHTKAAILDEIKYQNEELESVNEKLNGTILQLRQGKGACGHEVEIEVLKRRINSLKTFIDKKLKFSLSEGQATSLSDPEQDSGPQGETLPARNLQVLESERVLQSVRGLHHDGKADTYDNGDANLGGQVPVEETIIQTKATQKMAAPSQGSSNDPYYTSVRQQPTSNTLEEPLWKTIEARKPAVTSDSRGGVEVTTRRETQSGVSSPRKHRGSSSEVEEVTLGVNLLSESEPSSHYRASMNDTDSSCGPVAPPRRAKAKRNSKNFEQKASSGNESGPEPATTATAANQKHFDKGKSLPLMAHAITSSPKKGTPSPAPLSRFGEDSFYLPSSAQEGVDSLDDDEAPPLPIMGPPGMEGVEPAFSRPSSEASVSMPPDRRDSGDSMENSISGMSIRDRIAMIERSLRSDTQASSVGSKDDEDQAMFWKRKSSEYARQVESLDKENKFVKEDINRLEKELEEKRRYINTLEIWLSSTEDLLRNKCKQTDREMVEQLQLELTKLRKELKQAGYRSEDVLMDPAALKTELDHRDKEILSKRNEIEELTHEVKRWHKECRNIEGMRRTALDSLRQLEREVMGLQDAEQKLQEAQTELRKNKAKYDEMELFKNQALEMVQPLQLKIEMLIKKCKEKDALLRRLGAELRRGLHRPSSALEELTRLERAMASEEYNENPEAMRNGTMSPKPDHNIRTRSVSMDELNFSYSDCDSTHSASSPSVTPTRRQRPTPYVNNRPKSAETVGSPLRGSRGVHARSRWNSRGQRLNVQPPKVYKGQFVAIADYDPGLFSQSGRPKLELLLREGDQVTVTGPMDRSGYCEAEVGGRLGLVPAIYLQAAAEHSANNDDADQSSIIHVNHSSLPSGELYEYMQQDFGLNGSSVREATQESFNTPDPPHHLHIKGVSGNSLVLAWLPPKLDMRGCNKGFTLMGYKVYVNNKEYEQVPDPQCCEVTVKDLNLMYPVQLAVQSVCNDGHVSPRTELIFEGMVTIMDTETQQEGQQQLDTDLSSVLDSVQYKKGHKKTVIALYDYIPEQQSPHDYTAFELPFRAGDVISVYGEPRPDGFFHGEIEGKRGLIPACFVEDVSTSRRAIREGSKEAVNSSSKA